MRIGQGYDVHRLVECRDLIIGGVLCAAGIGLAIYSAAPSLLAFSGIGAVMILINIISNNTQKKYLHETCLLNIKNKNETK